MRTVVVARISSVCAHGAVGSRRAGCIEVCTDGLGDPRAGADAVFAVTRVPSRILRRLAAPVALHAVSYNHRERFTNTCPPRAPGYYVTPLLHTSGVPLTELQCAQVASHDSCHAAAYHPSQVRCACATAHCGTKVLLSNVPYSPK